MKKLCLTLCLLCLAVPALARPFDYNVAYGPEYFSFSSSNSTAKADLVTCGVTCAGELAGFQAGFRGGFGEISTTMISYNETFLLYMFDKSPESFLGLGPAYFNYENTLDKAADVKFRNAELNAKLKWARIMAPIWGFYAELTGPQTVSWELGALAYFDERLGDFNVRLGYRELRFSNDATMRGPYIASSVYF
ncbi:MAG: hypothetical protein JW782_06070 [Candidatus Saganbacteria bacterium]|nr:hypothetical protein [Candidatus Saganbacteria bacterium]